MMKRKKNVHNKRGGAGSREPTIFDDIISSDNSTFNRNKYVRESHNCYMYFLNKTNDDVVKMCKKDYGKNNICRRAQPGYAAGLPLLGKSDYKCSKMLARTLIDNPDIYKVDEYEKCAPTHYKGALVVAPGRDYHYYRYNDDGAWTHKPGYKPSTTLDSDNNIIRNPRLANRDYGGTLNYKDFCSYLCVPRSQTQKRMSHWNDAADEQARVGGGGRKNQKTKKKKVRTAGTAAKKKMRAARPAPTTKKLKIGNTRKTQKKLIVIKKK